MSDKSHLNESLAMNHDVLTDPARGLCSAEVERYLLDDDPNSLVHAAAMSLRLLSVVTNAMRIRKAPL